MFPSADAQAGLLRPGLSVKPFRALFLVQRSGVGGKIEIFGGIGEKGSRGKGGVGQPDLKRYFINLF